MSSEFFNSSNDPLRAMATVDEKSPIGQKWLELGGKDGLGDPLDNAQPFSDQVGTYQQFANGAIFYTIAYGAVVVSSAIFTKWASISVTNAATYCGDLVQEYLGYPTDDSFPTADSAPSHPVISKLFEEYQRGLVALAQMLLWPRVASREHILTTRRRGR
jgi:hypothetical protein